MQVCKKHFPDKYIYKYILKSIWFFHHIPPNTNKPSWLAFIFARRAQTRTKCMIIYVSTRCRATSKAFRHTILIATALRSFFTSVTFIPRIKCHVSISRFFAHRPSGSTNHARNTIKSVGDKHRRRKDEEEKQQCSEEQSGRMHFE